MTDLFPPILTASITSLSPTDSVEVAYRFVVGSTGGKTLFGDWASLLLPPGVGSVDVEESDLNPVVTAVLEIIPSGVAQASPVNIQRVGSPVAVSIVAYSARLTTVGQAFRWRFVVTTAAGTASLAWSSVPAGLLAPDATLGVETQVTLAFPDQASARIELDYSSGLVTASSVTARDLNVGRYAHGSDGLAAIGVLDRAAVPAGYSLSA